MRTTSASRSRAAIARPRPVGRQRRARSQVVSSKAAAEARGRGTGPSRGAHDRPLGVVTAEGGADCGAAATAPTATGRPRRRSTGRRPASRGARRTEPRRTSVPQQRVSRAASGTRWPTSVATSSAVQPGCASIRPRSWLPRTSGTHPLRDGLVPLACGGQLLGVRAVLSRARPWIDREGQARRAAHRADPPPDEQHLPRRSAGPARGCPATPQVRPRPRDQPPAAPTRRAR